MVSRGVLLGLLLMIVGLGVSCRSTTRVSTTLSPDQITASIRKALTADGYREVVLRGTSELSARRSGSAAQPFGLSASVELHGSARGTTVYVALSGFSLVPLGDWADRLATNIGNQLRAAEREAETPPPPQVVVPTVRRPGLPPFTEQRHVLIVGVSQYRDPNFPTLSRARKDAEKLAEFLQSDAGGNIASDRVHILVDQDATRENVIRELVELGNETRVGDMIIIYFAGHAMAPKGSASSARYLLPHDGKRSALEATAIKKGQIEALLDDAEAQRQVVFLDSCFSGASAGIVERGEVEDDAFASLQGGPDGPRRVILTSTKGSEKALDSVAGSPHSPFFTSLLTALSGEAAGVDRDGDKRLSVTEVYNALYVPVTRAARAAGGVMHPQLYGDGADDLELLRYRGN